MPHYNDGTSAQVGDRVIIEFEVQAVFEGESACNVSLKAAHEVAGEYAPLLTTNSRFCLPSPPQVEDIVWGDAPEPEESIPEFEPGLSPGIDM